MTFMEFLGTLTFWQFLLLLIIGVALIRVFLSFIFLPVTNRLESIETLLKKLIK